MVHRLLYVGLIAALTVASCTSSSDSDTTTTGPAPTITTTTAFTPTTQPSTTTTVTDSTIRQLTPPEYQITSRTPTDGPGDEVVVLLDPSSYDSLSDIDIFDVIAEVVELFPPVGTLHVVDDVQAASVVVDPEATQEQATVLNEHYLARLDEGFRITYLGPFSSSGTAILGS